jgi:hypothetical protein
MVKDAKCEIRDEAMTAIDPTLWVPIGTLEIVQRLAASLGLGKGRPPTSPGGRLLVIERKLNLARKKNLELWIQIIINPWELAEKEPVIDLLNVDSQQVSNFTLVDKVEGRFRWNHRTSWGQKNQLPHLGDWFDNLLQGHLGDSIQNIHTRNIHGDLNSGLRFPHGVRLLEEKLMAFVTEQGLELRTEREHGQHLQVQELEKEQIRQQTAEKEKERKFLFNSCLVRIQTASTLVELKGFENNFTSLGSKDEATLLKNLEKRREELQPEIQPFPDFDNPNFTTDTSLSQHKQRKGRGIREFENIG